MPHEILGKRRKRAADRRRIRRSRACVQVITAMRSAGVGGSTSSLATMFSISYEHRSTQSGPNLSQKFCLPVGVCLSTGRNKKRFHELTRKWPRDVRLHAHHLVSGAL